MREPLRTNRRTARRMLAEDVRAWGSGPVSPSRLSALDIRTAVTLRTSQESEE